MSDNGRGGLRVPRLIAIALALLCPLAALAAAAPLRIVAAENFYGDIASQIAGPQADVRSVLSNPDADPHLFEVDVATARAVTDADLVVYNGLHYDTWMTRLLSGTRAPRRRTVDAAAAARAAPGSNPHLWYDPDAMQAVARVLAERITAIDPSHRQRYAERLASFLASMQPLSAQIGRMRDRYTGIPVAATEPVADYLVAALGLTMRERRFQLAVMNGTEPSARDTAAFEEDLRHHRVRALLYNRQATSTSVERLLRIARQADVPIVAVTETEPAGRSYQQWMLGELGELDRALAGASPRTAPPPPPSHAGPPP